MLKKMILCIAAILILSSCQAAKANTSESKNFYYDDTQWGMTVAEVVKLKGEPTSKVLKDDNGKEITDENPEQKAYLTELYYEKKPLMENYTATEEYLFNSGEQLQGVIDMVDIGVLEDDLTNRDELLEKGKTIYRDLREKLVAKYGEPQAEYTAYRVGDSYKTDELLNLDKENAVICATRWDGDNYRFIYIMYFLNDIALDIRYIPHDKETVDRVNQEKADKDSTQGQAAQ